MTYSQTQVWLHWAIAGLVVFQIALHDPIVAAFELAVQGGAQIRTPLVAAHIFGGFVVFVLMGARLMIRLTEGAPEPSGRFAQIARLVHMTFYALLLALPVTGAIAWFRLSEGAALAHEVLRAVLVAFVIGHAGIALVHHFVWKDGTLRRMALKR